MKCDKCKRENMVLLHQFERKDLKDSKVVESFNVIWLCQSCGHMIIKGINL